MTKPKIGRNDPCHCGSGQKYKRCCQEKDETAERTARAEAEAAKPKPPPPRSLADFLSEEIDDDLVQLTETSNAVIKMVRAGQLDEAELAANELLLRFPEVHDGYDRLGMVAEARGDNKLAADYYRKVIDFVRAHTDQYESGFKDTFYRLIQKLDGDSGPVTSALEESRVWQRIQGEWKHVHFHRSEIPAPPKS